VRARLMFEKPLIRWICGFKPHPPMRCVKYLLRKHTVELMMIRRNQCPFCGRRFKGRTYLMTHLRKGKCKAAFYDWLEEVMSAY